MLTFVRQARRKKGKLVLVIKLHTIQANKKAQVQFHALSLGTSGGEGQFHSPAVLLSGVLVPEPVRMI